MDLLLFLLIGFGAGIAVAYGYLGAKPTKPAPVAPVGPETPAAPTPPVPVPPEEPLSVKLHRLSQTLETFGDSTAHPRELADRPEFTAAAALFADSDVALEIVVQYAQGANWTLACAAMRALAQRDDGENAVGDILMSFGRLRPWVMHFALAYFTSLETPPAAGAPAVWADTWWQDNLVIVGMFRSYFTRVQESGASPKFGPSAKASYASEASQIEAFLKHLDHPFATALIADLQNVKSGTVDTSFLEGFGRRWVRTNDFEVLLEPAEWKDLLAAAENTITKSAPRSILVRGDSKVGKSSFLKLLGDRLLKKGWIIFEAGGPELQAGQSYIGQLEERVRRLAAELSVDKRALWYVPDLLQIAVSGTHSGQTASILDQVLPAVSSGRLVLLSEATPTQVTQLVQLRPNLKGVFEVAPINAMTEERTLEFVQSYIERLSHKTRVTFEAGAGEQALQLAKQYLGTAQLPGSVIELVKLSYNRCVGEGTKSVSARDILLTLSQTTGLPVAILDSNEKVELADVHRFFGERVMGQGEAVRTVVDRIAMLKAGLTDPGKPIGVFLFAGPTGTGKTELAKTLAEFLFASADRLIRLDMSELKTPESLGKIIGDAGSASSESLINRVRKQPFSVVLLDEFEKAHGNVWDLFLQVFDDGRLSDPGGNVADFRHCIIILTSNLGATAHQGSLGLGFGAKADTFSSDHVMRAIGQAFRPEFINRLDNVIVFQPLKRELMRDILQKELRHVLDRRGLRNREWAVEWEASALDFLLDKGFTPELGARPLKRAIDQYLLAPLAATIVEHRFPEGDQFLFVRSDGRKIDVEFVDPDADKPLVNGGGTAAKGQPLLAEMMLSANGSSEERAANEAAYRALTQRVESSEWQTLSTQLAQQMNDPAIWSRSDRYDIMARFALMDRVKAAMKTAESLRERLDKSRDGKGAFSSELTSRLAKQIHVVGEGIEDGLAGAPVESLVMVESALEGGNETTEARMWCAQVAQMYRGWAAKRAMQVSEHAVGGATILAVSGFGAHRCLAEEAGLHVLEPGEGEDERAGERLIARVRVAPAPLGDLKGTAAAKAYKKALDDAAVSNAIVRRYRGGLSPLVRDAKKSWRSGKLETVLGGDFDLIGAVAAR